MTLSVPCPTISSEAALRIVAAALDFAKAKGWPVAVAVAGADGALMAAGRMDGVTGAIMEFAMDKAYTAAMLRKPSGDFGREIAQDLAELGGLSTRRRLISWRGGLPMSEGGAVIGAVGVSGVAGPDDEACAAAGIAAALKA